MRARCLELKEKAVIPGMTLQDWFAGQILASMIGSDPMNANNRDENGRLCGMEPTRLANMAKAAYQAAEALAQCRPAPAPARSPAVVGALPRDPVAAAEARAPARI